MAAALTIHYPFAFSPTSRETVAGALELGEMQTTEAEPDQETITRAGTVTTGTARLAVQLYSSHPSAQVLYLRQETLSATLAAVLGVAPQYVGQRLTLPGQTLLGGARVAAFSAGVAGILQSEPLHQLITQHNQTEIAIVPVLREGVKYQIAEMLHQAHGYYCEEIVVDAHHVVDQSVPGYGRRVEVTAFKDADLTDEERAKIKIAIVGDSTASGIVIIGLLDTLRQRLPNLERVEVVAPLATLFACARIARHAPANLQVRIHAFETLLNSDEPDYYWSPHYVQPELHVRPRLQQDYRDWWGQDTKGNWIADTACAGYGWSEAFFHPQKYVRMMNGELQRRHGVTIAQCLASHAARQQRQT